MKRLLIGLLLLAAACSETSGTTPDQNGGAGGTGGTGGSGIGNVGTALSVPVAAGKRTFVSLRTPAVVTPADGATSTDWDLAFEGLDIYTNSGPSGPGEGGAFGPHPAEAFLADVAPEGPFVTADETGGAFVDWYAYDGATHTLWNRYHVYGIEREERAWKVQVLGYYADVEGAPVSAMYTVRYAEVFAGSVGETVELKGIDGTAGGPSSPADVPSECLDLATGQRTMLTPEAARASNAWDLCFRRAAISVNGELGGPRGVRAADLDGALTAGEELTALQAKTADTEAPHFAAVGSKELNNPALVYRGDRVVSAFSDHWLAPDTSPPAPAPATWLVVGADGASRFLVTFDGFEGATSEAPGTVKLRVKAVK
ncbi:MAG: HmuY family protein [Minicystis sp.]